MTQNNNNYHYNPYNFIPLGERCRREPYERGDLTGKIHCTLIPRSDFFIPNTSNTTCKWNKNKNPDHCVKEFFSYENLSEDHEMKNDNFPKAPVVPGSELRGMIRNMYETFSDSCLSSFDDKELSSRLPIARNPGILEMDVFGRWKLYKADKYSVNTDKKNKKYDYFDLKRVDNINYLEGHKTFSEIKFDYAKNDRMNNVTKIDPLCKKTGFLIIGEKKPDDDGNCLKHNEYIFSKKLQKKDSRNNEKFCTEDVSDKLIKSAVASYNKLIDIYNSSDDGKQKWYIGSRIDDNAISQKRKEHMNKPISFPVWYHIVKDKKGKNAKLYLSPSCIGRSNYNKTLRSFIKNYYPCDGKSEEGNTQECFCESCRLFGLVNERTEKDKKVNVVLSSSVRVSDAVFSGKVPEYRPITTLKELSGPKITCMEMYTHLVDIASEYWTYEFYKRDTGEKNKSGRSIYEYVLLNDNDIIINGRKFYYHNTTNLNYKETEGKKDKKENDSEQTERNITVRPLKGIESNKFEFDLFFEHISEEQLKKLLVVLSMRGNDSDYCYKLGTGKPLGLGSVKVLVDDVMIRTIDKDTCEYSFVSVSDKYNDYFRKDMISVFDISNERLEIINDITNLKKFDKYEMQKIAYPVGKDKKGKIGEGYQWFMNNRGNMGNPVYKEVLSYSSSKLNDNVAK